MGNVYDIDTGRCLLRSIASQGVNRTPMLSVRGGA